MLKKLIVIALLGVNSLFAINKGMLNISDLDIEVGVMFDVGQFQEDYAIDSYFFGASYIDSASGNNGAGNTLISGNLLVINDVPDREDMRLGFGAKLVSSSLKGEDFMAFPLGAVLEMSISEDTPRYWISQLYYAPGALSFKDARAYLEIRTGVHLEAIENVKVFLEGRGIYTSYEVQSKVTFNETIYGGIEVGF